MTRWAPVFLALAYPPAATRRCGSIARAGDQISRSPEHSSLAAVDNEPNAFVARAGSTPRGYDGIAAYGPSTAARQMMRALETTTGCVK